MCVWNKYTDVCTLESAIHMWDWILLLQIFWFSGKKRATRVICSTYGCTPICVCNNTMTQSTVPRCGDRSFSGKKSAITYC